MRIKDFVNVRNVKTDRTDLPYIALENIEGWEGKFLPTDIQSDGINSIYHSGDVLFGKLRPYLAKVYIPENDGVCSSEFLVMKAKKSLSNEYLKYYLLSPSFIDYIKNQVAGVKMPRTNWSEIGNISVDFPAFDEQTKTVASLNEQFYLINKRICLRERELQTLVKLKQSELNSIVSRGINPDIKLKDSGYDWIGQIPEHWHTVRLKDVAFLYGGLTGKAGDDFRCEDLSKTKPFIPFTNILNNTVVDFAGFKQVVMSDNEDQNRVHENDILFLMSSEDYESIGKTAIVIGDPGEVYLNSFCRGLRFTDTKTIYPKYINYLLLSDKYRDALRFEARGFTRINLRLDKISSLSLAIPPIEEQRAIVEYIDEKFSKIDRIVSNINEQIDKLKVLKKSLINEVITGQRNIE